jgi:protein-S-isoprenylcysteine O-methyltransferase Ste14
MADRWLCSGLSSSAPSPQPCGLPPCTPKTCSPPRASTPAFGGLALRWAAILTLGKAFSVNVAIHHDQQVMRSGVFRYLRHPSYTGMMLIFLALGLHMGNWVSLVLVLLPPLAALLYRIHVEEAALNRAFGADYADYSRSTSRLIPGIY